MPARRRWPLIVAAAVLGVIVGLLIGLAVAGGEDSDPEGAVRDAQATADRAAAILETVPIEYGQAVRGGEAPEEGLRGAVGAVERSRSVYMDVRPVISLVDARTATEIDHAYPRLAVAIRARRPAHEVARSTAALQRSLRDSLGA